MNIASTRDGRTLVWGIVVVASLVTMGRGRPVVRRWAEERVARGIVLRERLALVRDARAHQPAVRDTLRNRQVQLASWSRHFIQTSAPAVGAAKLGAIIERLADVANVKISALELRADSLSRAAAVRVAVRFSGEGDVMGLSALLTSIERGDPILIVRELSVSQPDPAGLETHMEVLHFEVAVESIALVDGLGAR